MDYNQDNEVPKKPPAKKAKRPREPEVTEDEMDPNEENKVPNEPPAKKAARPIKPDVIIAQAAEGNLELQRGLLGMRREEIEVQKRLATSAEEGKCVVSQVYQHVFFLHFFFFITFVLI